MRDTMRAFWQCDSDIVESNNPRRLTLVSALNFWADIHGEEGNFFGLIDDNDCTIQFYFLEGIPDHIEDAGHLRIVLVDFPLPSRRGSFASTITIGETYGWIEGAFLAGASHEHYEGLEFSEW